MEISQTPSGLTDWSVTDTEDVGEGISDNWISGRDGGHGSPVCLVTDESRHPGEQKSADSQVRSRHLLGYFIVRWGVSTNIFFRGLSLFNILDVVAGVAEHLQNVAGSEIDVETNAGAADGDKQQQDNPHFTQGFLTVELLNLQWEIFCFIEFI